MNQSFLESFILNSDFETVRQRLNGVTGIHDSLETSKNQDLHTLRFGTPCQPTNWVVIWNRVAQTIPTREINHCHAAANVSIDCWGGHSIDSCCVLSWNLQTSQTTVACCLHPSWRCCKWNTTLKLVVISNWNLQCQQQQNHICQQQWQVASPLHFIKMIEEAFRQKTFEFELPCQHCPMGICVLECQCCPKFIPIKWVRCVLLMLLALG